ncbi:efflux RND transporter permease subunit [Pseudohongiella sp. O18]|uniref:efflux RND transporter permease subunit n=1 Tax=Pseudohongiella sp. O18 TaxID=2904248 RepID=UPI001F013FD6|nr:efflux RND transporter permease subunit [Pseudohongiella sp. O18]
MQGNRVFSQLIRWRWPTLIISLLFFGVLAVNAPKLTRDTSSDAFIDPLDPALLNRERVEEIFGLADPIVIAVVNEGKDGIYNPGSLNLVAWITDQLMRVGNIDPDQVTSLATESSITGTASGMEVDDFFETLPVAQANVDRIKTGVDNFPLYQGSLVARNGKATVVIGELIDPDLATETYQEIMTLLEEAPASPGDALHVTGEGAVAAYLSTYVDSDASRLNPLAAVVITIVLLLAFRTLRGTLLPNLIVLLTAGGTVGAMAASGVSFYVITNGLIVCMIGIAVADSVHIFSQYYEEISKDPLADGKTVTQRAMSAMWKPVTLTTLTTMAGFFALALTTTMPPIYYFGIFGAWAVGLAWLFSMTTLPAILSMLKPKQSRSFRAATEERGLSLNVTGRLMHRFGTAVVNWPLGVVVTGTLIAVIATVGAMFVVANEERIDSFRTEEPIHIADRTINRLMDGTYYLDVMIETEQAEGVLEPAVLRQIDQTQRYLETLPNVGGTTSIVDYIKRMHQAINEDDPDYYSIPDNKNLIAQLFLLYSASGDPSDFEEEIDGERRLALIRANVAVNRYQDNSVLVQRVTEHLNESYPVAGASATLTGDLNVDYHWIDGIVKSNLLSIVLCLSAVFLMASILFRSLVAGLFATVPVSMAVLFVYAVMGVSGIWLGVSTSMFASIAIGLGVDFSIHTLHSMQEKISAVTGSWNERLVTLYASTGRAQLFNFLAIALGFSVLMTSTVPPLVRFGALVGVAVASAFLAAMTLLPAMALVFKPAFLHSNQTEKE